MIAKRALVICAHPDDEALGCGGTMARLAAEGTEVHLLCLADGVGARGAVRPDPQLLAERRAMGDRAAGILGAQPPVYLDFPDNRMDSVPLLEVVAAIERIAGRLAPDLVLTHYPFDLNVDHRITAQAVLTAFRPVPGQCVRDIYAFEVSSSTEWTFGGTGERFQPNLFIDISSTLPAKLAALDAYGVEMRRSPHPRCSEAVTALATHRGSTVGVAAAEAYLLLRSIR